MKTQMIKCNKKIPSLFHAIALNRERLVNYVKIKCVQIVFVMIDPDIW